MTRSRHHRQRGLLLFLLAAALLAWALQSGRIVIPDPWNPWAPLRIEDPPNWTTSFKLSRVSGDRERCQETLAQASMPMVRLEDRQTGPGCGFENAVRIERTSVAVGSAFSLSCRAALSLAMWERHVLQQAALAHLDAQVAAIEHLGSYACRNVYGRDSGRRSQHATADALDIAGFVLDDGRRIRVLADWGGPARRGQAFGDDRPAPPETSEALFLRAVRDGACGFFDAVLGPDYNQAHADHLHFDRGRARICR